MHVRCNSTVVYYWNQWLFSPFYAIICIYYSKGRKIQKIKNNIAAFLWFNGSCPSCFQISKELFSFLFLLILLCQMGRFITEDYVHSSVCIQWYPLFVISISLKYRTIILSTIFIFFLNASPILLPVAENNGLVEGII